MNILLTNDDGVYAPGLAAIHAKLSVLGSVVVVAPLEPQSGMSHSITFTRPVQCRPIVDLPFRGYAVEGTPADCVKLACGTLDVGPFDLVISGINDGANVGLNLCYSGTVAAAIEATFRGIPACALSLVRAEPMAFDWAAGYALPLIRSCLPLANGLALNINLPHAGPGPPRGVRVVPQSMRGFHESYVPLGSEAEPSFQISGGRHLPEESMTDTMALSGGFITVTPLRGDFTSHDDLDALSVRTSGTGVDRETGVHE